MDERAKRKLQHDLERYWKNTIKLEGLNRKLKYIEQNIRDLRGILAQKEDLVPSPGQLSFIPGGGRGGSSEFTPIERSMYMYEMNQARIYEKIQKLRRDEVRIKCRILQLEFRTNWIKFISENYLDVFERQVFEQCYCYRRSNIQVGIALKCDEKTVRRNREKIINTFYEFLRLKA